MSPVPILILSDSPEQHTGLARIARDLARLLCQEPEFRVGFLGLRGTGSRNLPFPIYQIRESMGMYGEADLAEVWNDFSGGDQGIIFTIWDVNRVAYIGSPSLLQHPLHEATRKLCEQGRFKWWGYFPVDATGVGDSFPSDAVPLYRGCPRRLYYTAWAHGLAGRSHVAGEWIPHGIDLARWPIQDRREMRQNEIPQIIGQVPEHALLVGCVGTNQPRKDWGLTFAVIAQLKKALFGDVYLWAHTDLLDRHWNLPSLVRDFGLENHVAITTELTNAQLAKMYAACDVTFANGLGEGFGYPIAESLACGTPVVHGNYGGGAELIQSKDWLVEPVTYRIDTLGNCVRPVFSPQAVAEKLLLASGANREMCRGMVAHLDWKLLFPSVWKRWFLTGLEVFS